VLDDGYADWEETINGDELDIALVGELNSVSSGSSTLSGKTASMTSKRRHNDWIIIATKLVNCSRTYQHLLMKPSPGLKKTRMQCHAFEPRLARHSNTFPVSAPCLHPLALKAKCFLGVGLVLTNPTIP
jgi:hypothetical protein